MMTHLDILDSLTDMNEEACRALAILMEIPIDKRAEKQPQFSYKALLAREMVFQMLQKSRESNGDNC